MPCTFYGDSELSLMTGAGAGNSAGKYLRTLGKVLPYTGGILIIDIIDFVRAESANLFSSLVAEGSFRAVVLFTRLSVFSALSLLGLFCLSGLDLLRNFLFGNRLDGFLGC